MSGLHDQMTLSEIEQVIGPSEAAFRQAALDEIVGLQTGVLRRCPLCRGKLTDKGKRRKQVVTVRGETVVERTYYHCADCGRGYFPPR